MKKEIIASLGALGALFGSSDHAKAESEFTEVSTDQTEIVIEKPDLSTDTIKAVREITDHDAFLLDHGFGTVYIDLAKLPEDLQGKLLDSTEVVEVPDTNLLEVDQAFSDVLASQNIFSRTGNVNGMIMNQIILDKLIDDATPVLEEDVRFYMATNFM